MFRSLARTALRVPSTRMPLVAAKPMLIRNYGAFPALTRDVTRERVLELLEGYAKIPANVEITEDSNYIQDLGLDSLDVVEVMMEIEHEFNIQIPDDEADAIKTVGQTVGYVMAQPDSC